MIALRDAAKPKLSADDAQKLLDAVDLAIVCINAIAWDQIRPCLPAILRRAHWPSARHVADQTVDAFESRLIRLHTANVGQPLPLIHVS